MKAEPLSALISNASRSCSSDSKNSPLVRSSTQLGPRQKLAQTLDEPAAEIDKPDPQALGLLHRLDTT